MAGLGTDHRRPEKPPSGVGFRPVVALNGERRVEPSIWSAWTGNHCESSLPLWTNEDMSQSKASRLDALPV